MPKYAIWDRRLYLPSEGRRAEDFFVLKNPAASVGFEPANLGTKGQHGTSRPPKSPEPRLKRGVILRSFTPVVFYSNIILQNTALHNAYTIFQGC